MVSEGDEKCLSGKFADEEVMEKMREDEEDRERSQKMKERFIREED